MTNYETVATFGQPMESHILQSALESAGIETILDGEYTVANDPILSTSIGGIRLKVRDDQLELARPIVEDYLRSEREAREQREKTCPACSGCNGVPVTRPVWFAILALLTLGVFVLLFPWDRYRCPDCGHRWR